MNGQGDFVDRGFCRPFVEVGGLEVCAVYHAVVPTPHGPFPACGREDGSIHVSIRDSEGNSIVYANQHCASGVEVSEGFSWGNEGDVSHGFGHEVVGLLREVEDC